MMAQLALARVGRGSIIGTPRDTAEGDFVEEQIDQFAAVSQEPRDNEAYTNPGHYVPSFLANSPEPDAGNVIPLSFKVRTYGATSMNTLTRWNGYVDSIGGSHFIAIVYDTSSNGGGKEEARIPKSLLKPSERAYLKIGAHLQLVVGLSKAAAGNRVKETIVYFRRYAADKPSIVDELLPLLKQLRDESAG